MLFYLLLKSKMGVNLQTAFIELISLLLKLD